jgi:hypothetical protein
VKFVILRNLLPKEIHAAVAARADGQRLVLDNVRPALVRDAEMVGSIPNSCSITKGKRRFVPSNRAGQGSSASRLSKVNFVRRLSFGARKPPLSVFQPLNLPRAVKETAPARGRAGAVSGLVPGYDPARF